MYTLNEASAKLKEHKIIADSRKLIREAIAGNLWLSVSVHGHYYSPTIYAKCNNLVGKYLNELLGIESDGEELSDEITNKFEAEFIREVLNNLEWSKLNKDQKISYLIRSDLIKAMYQRYSHPSIGEYLLIYPKQLLNVTDGTYKIEYLTDKKNDYCFSKTVAQHDLLVDEHNLNKYIEALSDNTPTQKRVNRLYAEIMDTNSNWQSMSAYEILNHLKPLAGKAGSCINSVSNNSVTWLTEANIKNTTNLGSLQKWISRQNKT